MEEKKVTENKKINGFNIAALVLGIVSLVTWCLWIISVPCSILALIFGIIGFRKPGKGMALTGIITGGIAIAIWAIVFNVMIIRAVFDELDYRPNYKYCDCYNCYDCYDCDCNYDYNDYKGVYNIFTEKYDFPTFKY